MWKLAFFALVACSCFQEFCRGESDLHSEASVLNEAASIAFQQGKMDEAAKLFKKMDKLVGHLIPSGATNLAVVYRQQNKVAKAVKLYKKTIKRFPKDAGVALQYCRFGANLINSKEAAKKTMTSQEIIDVCKKAAELDKTNVEPQVLIGSVYVLTMQFSQSWGILEAAAKLAKESKNEPMYRQAVTNLALANLRGARPKQARKWGKILYKKYGSQQSVKDTYGHARSITLPYDLEAVKLGVESREQFVDGFQMKHISCPSGKWSLVWNLTELGETTQHSNTNFTLKLLNPTTAYTTFGSTKEPIFPGKQLKPYRNLYHEHYIYEITFNKDAFMWTASGLIHSQCAMIVGSHGVMWSAQEVASVPAPQYIEMKDIDFPVISTLPSFNTRNYYHWMVEGFIRFLYLEEYLARPEMSATKLLIPQAKGFIDETLKLVGVKESQILRYESNSNVMYRFKNTFTYIDWMAPKEDTYRTYSEDSWSPVFQPREGLLKVRARMHKVLKRQNKYFTGEPTEIVYVSREAGVRSISNERKLIDKLKETFGASRVVVHTGSESVFTQISMFQRAALVVGAHGAGLSNLVFMEENTNMILFPMDPHVDHTYGRMAAALNIRQYVLPEISSYYYSHYGNLDSDQIDLVIRTASDILDLDTEAYLEPDLDLYDDLRGEL